MVGIELAHGRKLDEIVGSMRMVAEGIKTTNAAVDLASLLWGGDADLAADVRDATLPGISPRGYPAADGPVAERGVAYS